MAKPVFITGATGLIGSALAMKLANSGEIVHALIRSPERAIGIRHKNIRFFEGELTDVGSVERAMQGCNRVFHLAAYARVWSPDSTIFDRVNYKAVVDLLRVAEKHGVEKVVVTSTAGVLGHSKKNQAADETAFGHPDYMTQYERSKARLEDYIRDRAEAGFPVVIVNPTRVYGPGVLSDSNGEVIVMQRYLKGQFRFLPGDGSSSGSYAFLDDVVDGHLLAMEKGRVGHRYILGGDNVSFTTFFETLARVSGKRYRMFPAPVPLLLGFARLQLFMAEKWGRYPLITPELVRKYTRNWDFSSEKAKQELGYRFISLEAGMERTLAWLKQEKHI